MAQPVIPHRIKFCLIIEDSMEDTGEIIHLDQQVPDRGLRQGTLESDAFICYDEEQQNG